MKANELRILNKVFYNNEIDTICEIGQANNGFCENNGYFNFDKGAVNPIPLTEDILLKCGFTSYIKGEYVLSKGFFSMWLKFYKNGNTSVILNGVSTKYLKEEELFICSVHKLQNLYFALTNTELEINL